MYLLSNNIKVVLEEEVVVEARGMAGGRDQHINSIIFLSKNKPTTSWSVAQ